MGVEGRLLLKGISWTSEPGPSSCSFHVGGAPERRLASADPLPSFGQKLPCILLPGTLSD